MASVDEVRARLLSHFKDKSDATHGEGWVDLWAAGDFLPWDRGQPNPALEDTLKERTDLLGSAWTHVDQATDTTGRRKRAFVPGCGRGYDLLLLASFGYDAYGLDIAKSAVEKCEKYVTEHAKDYPPRDPRLGSGKIKCIHGDFFKGDWLREVEGGKTFELIYDYTFLCALPPTLRPAWSHTMVSLLSDHPSSCLVCVEFPTTKPPSTKGPPFGLPEKVYVEHLGHPGQKLPYDEEDNLLDDQIQSPPKTGLERIARWQPERTHEIGKGTDWVSVWRRKAQSTGAV